MRLILLAIALLMSTNCYAFNAATGTITTPTSTGNASVTGLGFTPKVIILYSSSVSSVAQGVIYGFGAATSSSARWTIGIGEDQGGGSANNFARGLKSTKCLTVVQSTGLTPTVYLEADLVSMDADGFTLNWTTVQASGMPVYYLALGGSDLNAKVGTFDTGTGTGNQSITGVGFIPSTVLIGGSIGNTTEGLTTASIFALGVGTSSSNRAAFSLLGNNSVLGQENSSVQDTSHIYYRTTNNKSMNAAGDLVSMDADGFTINLSTNTAARRNGYIALSGINVKTGVFNQPTSTGNQSITGVGFTPKATLFMTRGLVSSSTVDSSWSLSIGSAVSSSSRNVASASGVLDAATIISGIDGSASKAIQLITANNGSNPTLSADADFVSNDSNGFTLNWTNADATAREVIYWALGQASSGTSLFDGVSNINGVNIN